MSLFHLSLMGLCQTFTFDQKCGPSYFEIILSDQRYSNGQICELNQSWKISRHQRYTGIVFTMGISRLNQIINQNNRLELYDLVELTMLNYLQKPHSGCLAGQAVNMITNGLHALLILDG